MTIKNRQANEKAKTVHFKQVHTSTQYYIELSGCKSQISATKYYLKIAILGSELYSIINVKDSQ